MSKIFDALREAELASRSRSGLAVIRNESAHAVLVVHATDPVAPLRPPAITNEGLSRHGTSRYLIWFLLGAVLLSAAVVFLSHYMRGVGDNRQATEVTAARNVPGILPPASTAEQPASALPAALSSKLPGFVLQAAAMKHEENAQSLAETLHRRNFPVFIFKSGTGPLYRVAVGVYGDVDSARRVKNELEKQGFMTILRRWSSE